MNEPVVDEKIGNEDLYRALKLVVVNYDQNNQKKEGYGTGFIVRSHIGNSRYGDYFLVTNRHVVDRSYAKIVSKRRWLRSWIESIEVKGHFQHFRDEVPTPESVSLKIRDPEPVYARDEDIDIAVIALSDEPGSLETIFHTFDIAMLQDHHDVIGGAIQVGSPLLMPGIQSWDRKFQTDRSWSEGGSQAILATAHPWAVSTSRGEFSGTPSAVQECQEHPFSVFYHRKSIGLANQRERA